MLENPHCRWPCDFTRHVKAHTGVYGNEKADRAANEARLATQPLSCTSGLFSGAVRSVVLTNRGVLFFVR